jgi:hypothetical protein
MRNEHVDYLIFDYVLIKDHEGLIPLWEKPELACEFGLRLVQKDPEGLFQIYSLPTN